MLELLLFIAVIIIVVVAIKLGKQDNVPAARPSGLPDGLKMARRRAAMKEFLLNRGADTGKVHIIANTPETGILNVYFEDYDIKADLHLDTDITPILSHEYQFEDELTPEDVCALHNAAADGTLTRCPLLLQLCK